MSKRDRLSVKVMRLTHGMGLPLPAYQTADAAGMDLLAAIPQDSTLVLEPGQYKIVPAGIAMSLPAGTEAQIRPRSGLAAKYGVTVLNSPGTIDADYRGEIGVILINHGRETFHIRRGDRIAQMVVARVAAARLAEVTSLSGTARGAGGYGSTGVKHKAPKAAGAAGRKSNTAKSASPKSTSRKAAAKGKR